MLRASGVDPLVKPSNLEVDSTGHRHVYSLRRVAAIEQTDLQPAPAFLTVDSPDESISLSRKFPRHRLHPY